MGLDFDHSSSIAVDTNFFIFALDHPGDKGKISIALLDRIKKITPRVFISVLVVEEFFIKIFKESREKEVASLLDFITMGGLASVVNFDREIALRAAKIRAAHKSIRTPDAIHLACAIWAGASIFFSFDRRLPRKVEKLTIRVP